MRHALRVLAVSLLCALGAAGCGGSAGPTAPTPVAPPTEADLVTAAAATTPEWLGDDVFDVTSSTAASARHAGTNAAVTPLAWYRWFYSATRTLSVALADSDATPRATRADVTVDRDLQGMLHLVFDPADGAEPDTHDVIHKLVHDQWQRKLRYARVSDGGGSHWQLTHASGVRVRSFNGSRSIASVTLTPGAGATVTLTDPAALLAVDALPAIPAGDSITVNVSTGAADDVVALYYGAHRERLHANGDGTFWLRFASGPESNRRNLAVNVLSHGTLYDSAQAYDSMVWILPVRVAAAATAAAR